MNIAGQVCAGFNLWRGQVEVSVSDPTRPVLDMRNVNRFCRVVSTGPTSRLALLDFRQNGLVEPDADPETM
jgi:hypothetical protein